MKRSPIRQKKSLAPLPIIGFEIRPAGLTVVDTNVFFSLDRKGREPMIVRTLAERAPNSPISPARAAIASGHTCPEEVTSRQYVAQSLSLQALVALLARLKLLL
jgi:hypothetical protein